MPQPEATSLRHNVWVQPGRQQCDKSTNGRPAWNATRCGCCRDYLVMCTLAMHNCPQPVSINSTSMCMQRCPKPGCQHGSLSALEPSVVFCASFCAHVLRSAAPCHSTCQHTAIRHQPCQLATINRYAARSFIQLHLSLNGPTIQPPHTSTCTGPCSCTCFRPAPCPMHPSGPPLMMPTSSPTSQAGH